MFLQVYIMYPAFLWVRDEADPRTDPWSLVHSPLPWKPLKLRGLLIAYNLTLMTLSSYMFYEVRRQDWLLELLFQTYVALSKSAKHTTACRCREYR
uniref:Uncharacterized protein n=1 Tax=Strix occidentalis caurina TaxID=311401 RepID=A0A8D0FG10_STROC